MANTKISGMTAAAALTGTELLPLVQGGANVRSTAAAVAALGTNLTGVITSVGPATSIASQTGTGTKFVVDTNPVLVTPNLGTPSAVNLTNATALPLSAMPAAAKVRVIGTTFGDTAGSALTSGSVVYLTCPFAGTISAWNICVDAGTCTIDIWKIASGTAIPTVANTITASALPALASNTALHSTTLTGWTTAVTANDIFGFQLTTTATAKFISITVEIDQ